MQQTQPTRTATRRPQARRPPAPLPMWLLAGIVVVALAGALVVGSFAFSVVRTILQNQRVLPPPVLTPAPQGTAGPNGTPPIAVTAGLPDPQTCKEYTDRVSVLLLGIDQRQGEKAGEDYFRTDTMLLLSLDPVAKTGVMLSIPRDLWVTIPDFGIGEISDRINTANFFGDRYKYPGGGPALAMRTVQKNMGIPVQHYVRLNFTAFEDFVDRIGGIDVVVPEDIYDPEYPTEDYNIEVFQISAGPQHLDGPTALKYARTRHTPGSDFDRVKRQQQVILAVRDKVTNLGLLPQLLPQLPEMYGLYRDSVQTDLSFDQLACLAMLSQDVPRDRIRSAAIDQNYTTNGTTPEGAQVLIPNWDKIGELMLSLYAPPASPAPGAPTATPGAPAQH
jgi:LCP family protein required for cell wall assembly